MRRGVAAAGGLPVAFPVMSLSEDLMKPTAMLYRNLLAIEVEETIRSQPLDGVVALGNCDKTVPAYLMALASADIPALIVTGGYRPVASFRGERLGSGTALWRVYDERRAGRVSDADWAGLETCLGAGLGACNTMGTASTMAIMAEALGMALPGSAVFESGDPAAEDRAEAAGRQIVSLVAAGARPSVVADAGRVRAGDDGAGGHRRVDQRDHPPVRGGRAARDHAAARAVRRDRRPGPGHRRHRADRDRADGRPGQGRGRARGGGGDRADGGGRAAAVGWGEARAARTILATGRAGTRCGGRCGRFPIR